MSFANRTIFHAHGHCWGAELDDTDIHCLHDYITGGHMTKEQQMTKAQRAGRAAATIERNAYFLAGHIKINLPEEASA